MKKTIYVIAILFLSINASASDWQHIGDSENASYRMDFDSIAQINKYRKAWVEISYRQQQKTNTMPEELFSSARYLYYFDCKNKTELSVQFVTYEFDEGKGRLLTSSSVLFSPWNFSDVIPDSTGEIILRTACSSVSDRKKIKAKNRVDDEAILKSIRKVLDAPPASQKDGT